MIRLRFDFGYDGTDFFGWAKQPELRTVQGEFESALSKILRYAPGEGNPRLTVAGRTDTGVHALHQVCHADIDEERLARCVGHMRVGPVEALQRRLSRVLPPDIALHAVAVAPAGFDARFSALQRTYVYRVSDASCLADPRMRHFVLRVEDRLDVESMNAAVASTVGLHDFGSFATPNPGGTTIREVKSAHWDRVPIRPLIGEPGVGEDSPSGGSGNARDEFHTVPSCESGLLCFTIVADAFARNMVRSLVGASLRVGQGKRSVDWFLSKMEAPVREGESGPCPPQGLTLEHIAYPPDDQLATRAAKIRAVRTL
ncbi:tRNA pseudouridine synthase A [Bifidobacterium sp. UBA744]|uniref:tRNA pseudouridine synthase A n=1 Tax=Bifidobacterium sp. UBA744 TaxID=1946112 RepID=UPI0025C02FBD|nr:tRNA pseudouridine synthase A [Bifidobacterium sp. UBA744]